LIYFNENSAGTPIAILYSLPPIAIFYALRRYMALGLTAGGING